MNFDKNAYTVESLTVGVHTIRYRQFADLLYADLPANAAYQRMHIYAPEGFYEGESIKDIACDCSGFYAESSRRLYAG